ncbi:class I adenylate-forming enzyme family protein [Streptomyces sp. AC495_CC817]|uniref:class I adenylate-forming enzyme family protein n=1 Tax=Streptomyces sp. AC495_CC817 TaxID=2823900 RepID=UPI001C2749FF|nr:AMP-binding protein [Streptomyces sp. AC495_CC817]
MAIIDFFDRGWRQNPLGPAFVMGESSWTYDEAGALSCRIARALLDTGLPGAVHAAVLAPNDPAAWICVLGIWRAGKTWVPLHPGEPAATTAQLMEKFDCTVLFFHSSQHDEVQEILALRPDLDLVVCIDSGLDGRYPSLAEWSGGHPSTKPVVTYDPEDIVMISPTGGTTGVPKGVMNSHRSLAAACAHHLLAFSYAESEPQVNLAAAPLTHTAGLLSLQTSVRGGTVVLLARADPASVVDAIERFRVTDLFLPPTAIYRMLDWLEGQSRDFSSLRYLAHGAAPMSVEKLKRAIDVFGPVLMCGYGQTEAFAAISFATPDDRFVDGRLAPDERLNSCGRPGPLLSLEIRDDEGMPVPVRVNGEICVRGDLVMRGYYGEPEKTAETLVDGWLHTGDIGYLDGEGYLHITDRKKDIIISGGYNVYPSEIEQVIWSHPAVNDCAVIGVPHDDWGEMVVAVVEPSPGHRVAAEELIDWAKTRLGSVRTPKRIDVVTELPRSGTGKVLKRAVRDAYWAATGRRI